MPNPIPLSAEQLEKIAEKYGTPFHLYDEKGIRKTAGKLKQAFEKNFPGFREFFAVKALPNPAILKIMQSEGFGLDCSSASELYIAEKLQFPGEKIMFSSNYTAAAELKQAYDLGAIINLDDISLIDSLLLAIDNLSPKSSAAIAHESRKNFPPAGQGSFPKLICFRLNPGIGKTSSETKSNVLGGPGAKYGVPREQIVEAYRRARLSGRQACRPVGKARDLGATKFGIHMMTGSCVLDSDYFREVTEILLDVMGEIKAALDLEFQFFNIGGGFGIPYRPEQKPLDLDQISSSLKKIYDQKIAEHKLGAPKLYMEHGRYLTGPNGWLVSRCQAIKKAYGQTWYGLDACMANLMRPGMYEAYHHITVPAREAPKETSQFIPLWRRPAATQPGEISANLTANESDRSREQQSIPRHHANVVGTLCENNDWFAKDRDLPVSQTGDLFVIHDTGAHGYAMGFQYNGKLRSAELLLRENGEIDLIREHEKIEDLFSNTRMPQNL